MRSRLWSWLLLSRIKRLPVGWLSNFVFWTRLNWIGIKYHNISHHKPGTISTYLKVCKDFCFLRSEVEHNLPLIVNCWPASCYSYMFHSPSYNRTQLGAILVLVCQLTFRIDAVNHASIFSHWNCAISLFLFSNLVILFQWIIMSCPGSGLEIICQNNVGWVFAGRPRSLLWSVIFC